MPKAQSGVRQRPVSCTFCRTRKLRCSRDIPCSNCTSRGIACDLESLATPISDIDGPTKSELLDRIQKLEELVEKVHQPGKRTIQREQYTESPATSTQQTSVKDVSPETEQFNGDVAWLESIYMDISNSHTELLSNKVRFRVSPVQCLVEALRSNDRAHYLLVNGSLLRQFWLPQQWEARILLEKFTQDIEFFFHHVVHLPSLPGILDRVYASLDRLDDLDMGEVILLISVFASATHSWEQADAQNRGLFSTHVEAHRLSEQWVKATEDLLDIARRTTRVSMEGIMGIVVLVFIPEVLGAFARRCRYLVSTAILLARELGLHCIDHPSHAQFANTARAEIGRRLWWHIASTDWAMAARFNDIPQGVYQCHMRHMMTHKPLNLDDEDVVDGMARVGQPPTQPTGMSYSLLRIRLCEISRGIVDRTPLLAARTSGTNYDAIMDIDSEMQALLNDVPPFFSMCVDLIMTTYNFDRFRATHIARQGHIFYSLAHAQRCKLHLPYLSRGFTDPTYAPSRDICIESARLILQTEADIDRSGLCDSRNYKPLGLIMSVFMACIVLLMDICHVKGSPQRERQRSEIADAFRMLDSARSESNLATDFLDTMIKILHKHNISLPKYASQSIPTPASSGHDIATPSDVNASDTFGCSMPPTMLLPDPPVSDLGSNGTLGAQYNGPAISQDLSYFTELAQSLDQGINAGSIDWNNIFSDIDSFM